MTINQRDHVVGLLDHEEWNLQKYPVLEVTAEMDCVIWGVVVGKFKRMPA